MSSQVVFRTYKAIFLSVLLLVASSGKALFSGIVFCIHGSDHVALEFEHDGHVSLSIFPDFASEGSQLISRINPQQETNGRCLDIPISLHFSIQSVTSVQPDLSKIVTPVHGASTSPSNPCSDGFCVAYSPHPPSFQTQTCLSLHTTILLI